MKRLDFRSVIVVLLAAAAGCKGDPTSELRTGASQLALNPDLMFIDEGDKKPLEVTIRDQQLNPVAGTVQVASTNAAVFTVAPDTVATSADLANYNFNVTAVAPGQAKLVATSGGISDTATITVLPVTFTGTFSTATPIVGDTLKVFASAQQGFDPATANIDFGGGALGAVVRANAETLVVRVAQPDGVQPAAVTVLGVAIKYAPGVVLPELPSAAQLTVTPIGDRETPGGVIITPPASGGPDLVFWDGFKSGANQTNVIDYFFQFTLATTDTLSFNLSWDTGADLDMVNLRTNFTVIGGGGAASSANPEHYTVIFPAGTYYLLIESFDDADDPAHLFKVTIHNP